MIKVPAFFFPTSTVLVDDDRLYANLFIDSLDPKTRVEFIDDLNTLLNQKDEDFLFSGHRPQNVINSIEKCVEKNESTLERMISVVVADYHMDGITGLEFFRRLKSPFVYRILISNFIDERFESEINHAQNSGIIHAKLRKGESLRTELPKAIVKGQQQFFTKLGNTIYHNSAPQNCLTDTGFASYFLNLVDEYGPEYLWPKTDFSVFTFEKKSKTEKRKIFITTSHEIDLLLEGYNSQSASPKTIEFLKTGNFMVCHENPHTLDGEEWAFHLRPAKKIKGSNITFLYHLLEM